MKRMMMIAAMAFAVLFAGPVLADDTNIHNNVDVKATGGDANAQQNQKQKQMQDQQQAASAVVYGNLPEVGFVGFLNPGTPILGSEWKFYYSSLYARMSVKKIEKMRYGFHLSSLWPGNWGDGVNFTLEGESLPKNSDDILVMNYWPEIASNPGDEVLGTAIIVGKADWSEKAFLGEALAVCKAETMTRRVAISYSEYVDGVTRGASIGLSGSTAEASNGSGFVIASGAMIGKNKTRAERVARVKVLCMNDGPLYLPGIPTPPSVVIPAPAPPVCDITIFEKIILNIDIELPKCLWPCHNNQKLRFAKGNALMDKFYCGGGKDRNLLIAAIAEYGIAERDYINGRELKKGQKFGDKPKGSKTTTLASARELNREVYWNWSLAERELNGRNSQIDFARSHGLAKKDGSIELPTCQADMKR